MYNQPVLAQGMIFTGGQFGYLYAQRASDGKLLWSRFIAPSSLSQPVVAGGIVYVQGNQTLAALRASDGAQVWRIATTVYQGFPMETTIAVDHDTLFLVGSQYQAPGTVMALNTANGAQRWSQTVPALQAVTPVVGNGLVYVTGDGITALDEQTGKPLWHAPAPIAQAQYTAPALANGTLYVTTMENTEAAPASTPVGKQSAVDAIDARTGKLLWHHIVDGWPMEPVAVADGTIYTSYGHSADEEHESDFALALAADGSVQWSLPLANAPTFIQQLMPPPVVAGDLLVLPGAGLIAISRANHVIQWQGGREPRPIAPAGANNATLYADIGGSLNFHCGAAQQSIPTDGISTAFQLANGQRIWRQTLDGGKTSA